MNTDPMMVGGFLALAALTIGLFAWLGTDISRLDRRIDDLRQDMHQVIGGLRAEMDGRLRAVEHGQAKLEGLLQPAPDPAPAPGSNCREFLGGCIRLQLSPPRSETIREQIAYLDARDGIEVGGRRGREYERAASRPARRPRYKLSSEESPCTE